MLGPEPQLHYRNSQQCFCNFLSIYDLRRRRSDGIFAVMLPSTFHSLCEVGRADAEVVGVLEA